MRREWVKFSALALGGRFYYAGRLDRMYVKIDHNRVAEWDPDQVANKWMGQGVYSAFDDDAGDCDVVVEE